MAILIQKHNLVLQVKQMCTFESKHNNGLSSQIKINKSITVVKIKCFNWYPETLLINNFRLAAIQTTLITHTTLCKKKRMINKTITFGVTVTLYRFFSELLSLRTFKLPVFFFGEIKKNKATAKPLTLWWWFLGVLNTFTYNAQNYSNIKPQFRRVRC